MLYRPSPSLTTERTFSIRAGLAASTVTPGSTPPDVSLTTPAMPLACCAHALGASSRKLASTKTPVHAKLVRSLGLFIGFSFSCPADADANRIFSSGLPQQGTHYHRVFSNSTESPRL